MKARLALLTFALALGASGGASAHCDTLDGPVVDAARRSLDSGEVAQALIWVRKADEAPVREAYARARAARAAGNAERAERAELAYYATLVRVHRKAEGAGFTGLKPAGQIEPSVAAADRALAARDAAAVDAMLVQRARDGLRQRFDEAAQRKDFEPTNVEAGRAYVRAYVDYVHYVERVYDAAAGEADGHAAHEATPVKAPAQSHTPAERHGH